MTYDPEKYREKREKVLGIKQRGVGFGTIAAIVSMVIVLGISMVTVPQAVSYMTTRHLDDAIFKLESKETWPDNVIEKIKAVDGVKTIVNDLHTTRLVVTFDRRMKPLPQITALFGQYDLNATLLNEVNHRQHENTIKKEGAEIETP